MDLKDYFFILWRRKWIVILTTIAALVAAVAGTRLITPIYRTSTTLRVAATAAGTLNYTASTYSEQLINTMAKIANSRPIRDQLVERLGLAEEPVIISEMIPETELIRITVEYPDRKMAAQIANTLAELLIAQSGELYTGGRITSLDVLAQQVKDYEKEVAQARQEYENALLLEPPSPERVSETTDTYLMKQRNYDAMLADYNEALLQTQVKANMMTVVEPAMAPTSPYKPQATYNYLLGLAAGLLGGIVLALAAESFDSTLHSGKQIEAAAGLPTMAKIPTASANNLRMSTNNKSPLAEAFRKLAINLLLPNRNKQKQLLMITGAEPKQGKSVVAANLATALAEYGKNVVVVDCDMRLPRLHELFELTNESGLRDILEGNSNVDAELKRTPTGVSVLTSGSSPDNASQLLASEAMANLAAQLHKQFDFVLLDTPSMLDVADTAALLQNSGFSEKLDGFLLVARQSHAKRESVEMAAKFLHQFPEKSAGIVLNQTGQASGYHYYRPNRGHKQITAAEPSHAK